MLEVSLSFCLYTPSVERPASNEAVSWQAVLANGTFSNFIVTCEQIFPQLQHFTRGLEQGKDATPSVFLQSLSRDTFDAREL